jgi:hypothetical protein
MLEDHEVNKAKDMLIDIMLTGTTGRDVIHHSYVYNEKLVKADLKIHQWVLTDKGHRWLDEHV